jgi:hypothetical protein
MAGDDDKGLEGRDGDFAESEVEPFCCEAEEPYIRIDGV